MSIEYSRLTARRSRTTDAANRIRRGVQANGFLQHVVSNSINEAFDAEALPTRWRCQECFFVSSEHFVQRSGIQPTASYSRLHNIVSFSGVTLGDLDLCLGVCLSSLYAGYLLQDLVVRVYTRPTEPATSRHLSTLAKNLSHLIHLRKSICLVPSNVLIFCTMQMTIY
jgi:hypothetical protein